MNIGNSIVFTDVEKLVKPTKIGKINGAYGVLGWIKIISFTEKISNIFNYTPWFIFFNSKWRLLSLERWRLIGRCFIVKIKEISYREHARLLANCWIFIDESQLPILNDKEYYWKDIIGCVVITVEKKIIGSVINIIETVIHDILVLKIRKNHSCNIKSNCIPFVYNEIIKKVDLKKRVIVVDWIINF